MTICGDQLNKANTLFSPPALEGRSIEADQECPVGTQQVSVINADRSANRSAVREVRLALPNFYYIAVGIANVAARLAVLILWLCDELGASTSPKLIACMNIRNADIHEAVDCIGVRGNAERYRWLVGRRTAADIDNKPRVRDLDISGRTFAVASAQNAASKDLFIKSDRSFNVGDGDTDRSMSATVMKCAMVIPSRGGI